MVTYEITFSDGSTETITCKSYTVEGGVIKFLGNNSETLLMANMYGTIKFIKQVV